MGHVLFSQGGQEKRNRKEEGLAESEKELAKVRNEGGW